MSRTSYDPRPTTRSDADGIRRWARVDQRRVVALDVDVWKQAIETREPPVAVAEQFHRGRHQHHANQRRIDEDGDRHAEAEHLQFAAVAHHERGEDAHHDQRSGGDDPGGDGETVGDSGGVVARAVELLLDARSKKTS